MNTHADGGPAFPVSQWNYEAQQHIVAGGMSLRDYFAAKAMQAWLSTFMESRHPTENGGCDAVASGAYALADAMLKARTA